MIAGGDTDTNAAIAGALCGITADFGSMPNQWLLGIKDQPLSLSYLEKLSSALADKKLNMNKKFKPYRLNMILISLRNIIFLLIILTHGIRRLLPPY